MTLFLYQKKIDLLAIGEFDHTILELAEGYPENKIKGLVRKVNDEIIYNPPRVPLTTEQIGEFPFVTDVYKRHLTINNYFQPPHLHPFVDLFIGRGCSWGKCTFCLWPNTINKGASYRIGNIDKTIRELTFINEKMPFIKEIFIQDDTLPAYRCRELSIAIIDANLKINWSCYARPDNSYNLSTLKLMKKSGCRCLHVGYESSNLNILKNINKGTTPKIMEEFTWNAKKVGLLIHADYLIGLPGETVETIKSTVEWSRKLKADSYQFTRLYPYPGTPLHSYLKEHNFLIDGAVSYPHLSTEDIDSWVKWALRKTNLDPYYILQMAKRPKDWKRLLRAARHVIPNIIFKK